jgi:dipeptidase E
VRLLLLSNSRNPGGGWLDHAESELRDFFGPPGGRNAGPLLFFPFAAVSMSFDAYTRMAQKRFARMGHQIVGAHRVRSIRGVAGFLAGGGNTFRLLDEMQRRGWLAKVKSAARRGLPYAGWSAGSNLACPTIRTTNDMPVIEPRSLKAMGLVPFQLNPHYTERVLEGHGGESRDQRIAEFQRLNPGVPVLGLREGSLLRLEGRRLELRLGPGGRLFHSKRKVDYPAGTDLSFLLR